MARFLFRFLLALVLVALPAQAREASSPWLARGSGTVLRLLVWNVDMRFVERNADFQRVLRAADADVLVLDEMAPRVDAATIAAGLPAATGGWQVLVGVGGGPHERASVATRLPMRREPRFDGIAYPRDKVDYWLSTVDPSRHARARAAIDAGVATVGGIVDVEGRRVLVVGLDLRCCGKDADSPEEDRRRFEAAAIRATIDAALADGPVDAVLVGGDFNAVHGSAPVDRLRRGADARGALVAATARHRGSDAEWTWDGRGTPYPSARLDYAMHSPALVVRQAQVLDTEDLDAPTLATLGLDAELTKRLSPHRPVVVDFAWSDTR